MERKQIDEGLHTKVSHDEVDAKHYGAVTIPIYQNSLFAFENHESFDHAMRDVLAATVYSRGNNPTVQYLEDKIADLEGAGRARCFASGMAAIAGSLHALLRSGDHVVCVNQAYGPTRQFLDELSERYRVEVTYVDGCQLADFENALRPNTRLIYLESPTSGLFQLQDLEGVSALAKRAGVLTMIDSSWATPCFQRPLAFGVDLVLHSMTKYFSGHSDCLGGVVAGREDLIGEIANKGYMLFGGVMTPHTASLMIRGLRTLPLRMERHHRSGLTLATFMEKHPFVNRVNHPGLPSHPQHALARKQLDGYGSLFSFETRLPVEKLKQWADALQYFRIGVSWGGFESLVTVGRTPASRNADGNNPSVARLYIGLEDPQTLIGDIEQAWRQVAGT
ncbi:MULTISPECIES: PLP-dependent aspartate aminotransferase family protein [unclassified Paenibacillus]|uniref:trans-sulfuration enzyme family protein n=1 Tax=unclassified Paenibacillus TaxID=185978 RepID=UPI0010DBC1BA|nr:MULTISPECIES: PLP-dependent aspartate aminotransferase family protein [unclassified Paenibacillus]NIK66784.1 cystathionine beta-lyase/cystathionine gamma-synthase [Paenibacillus sp. BK720]TCN00764.1 cystathionine beta-lyase/cystathionine gamma-synthase [Paenibacillus sp. BK033]